VKVVAKVSRHEDYFIVTDGEECYLVKDLSTLEDEEKASHVKLWQRIEKIINNTIFLSNGKTVKFYFVKEGEEVVEKLAKGC